ncbi:MAG: DUF1801 domain-containing protein [bacterium]|nr:DUF1801 domain-containing protein [bacterium]
MSELKTTVTAVSVTDFINTVDDDEKRKDCHTLVKLMEQISGEKPKMWGTSIIGFGMYHYKSQKSNQEGDWPRAGFSPRKQALTVYIMSGLKSQTDLLSKLGKHKISGGSCIYIKKLSDINLDILSEIVKEGLKEMEKQYPLIT